MRTAYPEPGYDEADLEALLFGGGFAYASCFKITPKNGDPILTTSASSPTVVHTLEDSPVPITYPSGPIQISAMKLKASVGLEVDTQNLVLDFDPDTEIFGMPVANALKWGMLDGAVVETNRYYRADWGTPWVAGLRVYRGRVSSMDEVGRSSAKMSVKSTLILLDTQIPRDFFQSSCNHAFGDAGCGIDRASLAVGGTVGASSTSGSVLWGGATATMATGTLLIDNPNGVTMVRSIRQSTPGVKLDLAFPLPFTPTPGTAFTVLPGCKRTYDNCGVYANQARYKGAPFVPVAETAA